MSQSHHNNPRSRGFRESPGDVSTSRESPSENDDRSSWRRPSDAGRSPAADRHARDPTSTSRHERIPSRFRRAQAESMDMSRMSAAVPELAPQSMQTYAAPGPHHEARAVIMSPPGIVYQVPPGFAYSPASPYPQQPIYNTYAQPSFVHGYPAVQIAPSPYTLYPAGHHRQGMPPTSPYGQAAASYYSTQDPFAVPPQPFSSPARSHHPSRRNSHVGQGRGYTHHLHAVSPEHHQQHSISPDSQILDIPAGPPRKPKQSGYAIWVGNLPPTATILSLKEHFSYGFSHEIESLFLISKSNCAFVNYNSEDACNRAMKKFHDTRFHGVRLVCRLRKASVISATVSEAASTYPANERVEANKARKHSVMAVEGYKIGDSEEMVDGYMEATPDDVSDHNDALVERYFIVKSLTLQDLQQSMKSNVWATQIHNEAVLNEAFKTSDNVWLIFSVNKSGEYFGYARMESAIEADAADALGPIQRSATADSEGQQRTMYTEATAIAPRGHITDDMFRGTLFWEAEYTDDERDDTSQTTGKDATEEQTWGTPFRVLWKSTSSVPFWRTKGMRNPWNANREVKIARDGTELEPNVGERLLKLFQPLDIP